VLRALFSFEAPDDSRSSMRRRSSFTYSIVSPRIDVLSVCQQKTKKSF
jgi:hypothetical protein